MDRGRKMEGDYHGQRWTTWTLCKEGVTPSDIQRRLSSVCEQKASAWDTVFSWVQGFSGGKESAQVAVRVWYRNTPKNGCEVIRKVSRRWQRSLT
jgi:hypothetical protein